MSIKTIQASTGYLLVDTKKCQGGMSCMLACSLVHEGKENLSLSRIQIMQDPFMGFPGDIKLAQCRQCVEPACVSACPTGAIFADKENGNVRRVNIEKCDGCGDGPKLCLEACQFKPSRVIWDPEKKLAHVCDLCAETPFWDEQGGLNGKQACVEICTVGAIKFTQKPPMQEDDKDYEINLRGKSWKKLGYPTD